MVDPFLGLTTSFNDLWFAEVLGYFGIAASLRNSCDDHSLGFEQLLIISHFA